MEKKFDPRGKERKRTNRKKWYKAVCSLAAAVVVCTVYTLMLPALTLDEKSAGDVVTISESSVATSEAPAAERTAPRSRRPACAPIAPPGRKTPARQTG